MAVSKATTLKDLTGPAVVVAVGYRVVVSPSGYESTVPDGVVAALLDSGYKVK